MKKLLPVATLLALATSGMVSGAWSNSTITNTNPVWMYQIPEATVEAAKNWDASRESGVITGNNTQFSFLDKELVVLQGVMSDVLHSPTIGLQPVIQFGSGDPADNTAIIWDTSTNNPISHLEIKTTDNNGNITALLNPSVAVQMLSKLNNGHNSNNSFHDLSLPALALLKQQPYYNPTYGSAKNMNEWCNTNNTKALANGNSYYNLSSALEVTMEHFNLTYPTASIPETWAATLPISITHK